jgi:lysophospholipase L1-like esterase
MENMLAQLAEREKLEFIRMIQYFLDNSSRGPFHLLPRDPHCNPMGYQLIAEKISDVFQVLWAGAEQSDRVDNF